MIKKLDKSVRYESTVRFMIELILNLSVACWINVWYGSTQKTEDIVAFIVSVFTLTGMFILTAYAFYYPLYNFHEIKSKKLFTFSRSREP